MRPLLFLVLLGSAHGQVLDKSCLPEDDAGLGLSLAVDAVGRVHLSRIFRILGGLNHTVVEAGEGTNEELARFVSILGVDEVGTTDLVLEDGRPRICFRNVGERVFEVASWAPEGWSRDTIAMGEGVGRWCNLIVQNGRLVVVFGSDDGVVRLARRRGPADWAVEDVDRVAGRRLGLDGSATLVQGRLVVAHRTQEDRLRISWQADAGGFQSEDVLDFALGAGVDPVAVASGAGSLWVVHGVVAPLGTSDGGLVLTQGTPGAFRSLLVGPEMGGANGAVQVDGRLETVTRYHRRNAVFGAADGLRRFLDLRVDFGFASLEAHGSAEQRHTWNNLDIALDPFGFPVIAAQDEADPFGDDRGSARVCIWRARDGDGDLIPDDAESRYDTDPERPDTDGDGRSDGEEVLIDRTDPLGDGPLVPPDAGPPDAALADAGADAGDVDGGGGAADGGAGGGGGAEDAEVSLDGRPEPGDAASPAADQGPDQGPDRDAARDGSTPADTGARDGASPDAEGPRADRSVGDGRPVGDARPADDGGPGDADGGGRTVGGGSDGCRQGGTGRGPWAFVVGVVAVLCMRRRSW